MNGVQESMPIEYVLRNVAWLKEFLEAGGVQLRPGSSFERALAAAQEFADLKDGASVSTRNWRRLVEDAAVLNALAKAAHRAPESLSRSILESHQVVFAGGDMNLLRPNAGSKARDLAWEVWVGLNLAAFADHVQMVPAEEASRSDLRFSFNGGRWGAECKVGYSSKQRSWLDAIAKGAKQLECTPGVDHGFVFLNLSSQIDHARFLPKRHSEWTSTMAGRWTPDSARHRLHQDLLEHAGDAFCSEVGKRLWQREGKNGLGSIRGVCIVAQTITVAEDAVQLLTAGRWVVREGASPDVLAVRDAFEAARQSLATYKI